jgi:hypothetical protein
MSMKTEWLNLGKCTECGAWQKGESDDCRACGEKGSMTPIDIDGVLAEFEELQQKLATADMANAQLRKRNADCQVEVERMLDILDRASKPIIEVGRILSELTHPATVIVRGEPLAVGMDEQAHEPPTDRGESRRAVEACAGQARGIVDLTYAAARGPVPAKAAGAEEASFQSAVNPEEIL